MIVRLNSDEVAELRRQDVSTKGNGGWQSLIVALQAKLSPTTPELQLDNDDIERISRYAFDYGNGGWENRLQKIFGRILGPTLGRTPPRAA
jgi:hypothetical protein